MESDEPLWQSVKGAVKRNGSDALFNFLLREYIRNCALLHWFGMTFSRLAPLYLVVINGTTFLTSPAMSILQFCYTSIYCGLKGTSVVILHPAFMKACW